MGHLRFRRSVKIAPGIKVNFNKNSISTTIGPKGMHYTVNSKGKTTKSIGIPGTGLYYTETSNIKKGKKTSNNKANNANNSKSVNNQNNQHPSSQPTGSVKTKSTVFYKNPIWILALLLLLPPVGVYLVWAYTNWPKVMKYFVSTIFMLVFLIGIGTSVFNYYNESNDEEILVPENAVVMEVNGIWGLYKDESLVTDYNGLASNENGTWLISNGLVDFSFNGSYSFNGKSYLIENGLVSSESAEETSSGYESFS